MKISVVGAGYVGMSLSVLLSQKFVVSLYDIDKNKISLINKKSPFVDNEISKYLNERELKLSATNDKVSSLKDANYVIIATPTSYNDITGSFDTSNVEKNIEEVRSINYAATIIIKSTIPLGFTESMRTKYNYSKIFFSPEFLREGKALYDNLYPSRIIIGDKCKETEEFCNLLLSVSNKSAKEVPVRYMSSMEAESVKLFANAYLAMRVSYFNELDSFCETHNISTRNVIKGVCDDARIGDYYNNPSFGYGGYCLPKDTKQLLQNFKNVPNELILAIVNSNQTRKRFITETILSKKPKIVGIYKLSMKLESDNFRESAVIDIVNSLLEKNIGIILYEPSIAETPIDKVRLINNLEEFLSQSDLVVANRYTEELSSIRDQLYTRDIFQNN